MGRLAAAAAFAFSIAARAQDGASIPAPVAADQAPVLGQVSKDSVWVPTPDHVIYRMLQLADTTPKDLVIDLGSGDGRIPIMAAKRFGARAIGVELEENLVRYSRDSARRQGVAKRATFLQQDLFKADLSKATVIALYISPGVMTKLKPIFYDLKPGTRIVSHHFNLDDWEPDETLRVEQRSAHLWIVPEKVGGTWRLESGKDRLTVRSEQKFQELRGSAERDGKPAQLIGAKIRGRDIQFTIFDMDGNPRRYGGRVDGGLMKGGSDGDKLESRRWTARRG
jgi:SAM-dependent methyltransferase